jgi:O-antigen/teichoic acid export membrane protein
MNTARKGAWGAVITTAGNILEYAVGIVGSVVIAQSMSADGFGMVSHAIWLASILIIAGNHGVPTTLIVFVAEALGGSRPGVAAGISRRLGQVSLATTFIALLVFLAATCAFPHEEWGATPAVVAGLICTGAFFKARATALSGEALGRHFVYLLGSVVVALVAPGLTAFVAAYAVSALAGYTVIRLGLGRSTRMDAAPVEAPLLRRMYSHLWITAGLVLLGQASSRMVESGLLATLRPAAEFGFFSIAVALTRGAVEIMTSGLQVTLMPLMAHARSSRGDDSVVRMLNSALRYYLCAGLLISGAGSFLVSTVVLAFYGSEYAPAIPATQIAMVGAGVSLVSAATGAYQSVSDRQGLRLRLAGVTLAINVVLALALIPLFGLMGAALSFAITRVAGALISIFVVRSKLQVSIDLTCLGRLTLAGVAAAIPAAALYAANDGILTGVASTSLFLALYCAFLLLFRCMRRQDYNLLEQGVVRLPFLSHALSSLARRAGQRFGA